MAAAGDGAGDAEVSGLLTGGQRNPKRCLAEARLRAEWGVGDEWEGPPGGRQTCDLRSGAGWHSEYLRSPATSSPTCARSRKESGISGPRGPAPRRASPARVSCPARFLKYV